MRHFFSKLRGNQSGVILVTVILLTIVLAIVAISIMSLRVSQVSSGMSVVDSIKAEQVAAGAFYQYHQQQVDGCSSCPTPGNCTSCPLTTSESLDGKTYTVTIQNQGVTPLANNAEKIQADIGYQ